MATEPTPPAQLTDLLGSLRRRWPVVAVTAIIGLILGVLASFAIPSKYDAVATVAVSPMNADPLSSSVDASRSVSMPTEAGIARSLEVATGAAASLRPTYKLSATKVKDATTVTTPNDSLILQVHFSGSSAKQAAAGADAVAESYLAARRAEASDEIDRLVAAANDQLRKIRIDVNEPEYRNRLAQQALKIQANALGEKLAQLSNVDTTPGRVVGAASLPTSPSTLGPVPLGLAGLFLGLLAGIPIALLRKEENSEIGDVESLQVIGDPIVLDGTKDTNRADTWDIAAFMLKIPTEIGTEEPFMIMVDAEESSGTSATPGQELVDALERRGRTARFVDAGAINEGKISRGWPTEKKRQSWAGEIIIVDTTHLTSDANKVALATRSDSVLLARSTADDAESLRRLAGLLKSKGVDIALTALFPSRPEMITLHR